MNTVSVPEQLALALWMRGLGISNSLKPLDYSDVQPGLRIIGLRHCPKLALGPAPFLLSALLDLSLI